MSMANDEKVQTIDEKVPTRIKVKVRTLKPADQEYKNGIPWETFTCGNTRQSTNDLNTGNVRRLQYSLCGLDDMFYPDFFASQEGYDKVITYLTTHEHTTGKTYSINTQVNYLCSLSKYLEQSNIGAKIYAKYVKYRTKLEGEQEVLNARRTIVDFTTIIPKIYEVMLDPEVNVNVRIFALLILCSIDESDTTIGVLRLSDLINTKFVDDGVLSYIDIDKRLWIIRGNKTKNGVDRVINLPSMFTFGLVTLYKGNLPEFLVSMSEKKGGGSYNTTTSFSQMIKTNIGYGPSCLRASYVSYVNSKWSVDVSKRIASNSGHSYKTAISDYLRDSD